MIEGVCTESAKLTRSAFGLHCSTSLGTVDQGQKNHVADVLSRLG